MTTAEVLEKQAEIIRLQNEIIAEMAGALDQLEVLAYFGDDKKAERCQQLKDEIEKS